MKTLQSKLLIVLFTLGLIFTSCDKKEDNLVEETPTREEFKALYDSALNDLVQTFNANSGDGAVNFTSDKGVVVNFNTGCLTLENGDPISGDLEIKYVEIFDKADMVLTKKSTMGKLPNGDKAMLVSGGEFLIEVTNNGSTVISNCNISLNVPASLTGGVDNDMTLWKGTLNEDDNIVWDEDNNDPQREEGVYVSSSSYNVIVGNFGWVNVDRFYSDTRPKTTLKVQPPAGYDNENSVVYLSYDGEDNSLAFLDIYNEDNNYFSEHYGQVPIGLECHIIFMTEDNGNWKYSIQPVTIAANQTYTFTLSDLQVATTTQITSAINALP